MDDAQFADGFDAPDQLVFGLGAGQLLVVVVGVVAAYLVLRAPFPGQLTMPFALLLAVLAAALGWLRIGGRAAFDWAMLMARYATRQRDGALLLSRHPRNRAISARCAGTAHRTVPIGPARIPESQALATLGDSPKQGVIVPLFRASARASARRVVFFSLRGGSGRTTLSVEVACWLAANGRSVRSEVAAGARMQVALVDMDACSPSVAVRLGIPQPVGGAAHRSAPGALPDIMAVHRSGVHVVLGLPLGATAGSERAGVEPIASLLTRLDGDGFDAVVMDVGAGVTAATQPALLLADDIFVVVTPTASGVQDAYRSTEALRRLGLREQLRYVVNRARSSVDLSDTMADLAGQLVAEIPEDASIVDAENQHRLVALEGSGPAASSLRELGAFVLQLHGR